MKGDSANTAKKTWPSEFQFLFNLCEYPIPAMPFALDCLSSSQFLSVTMPMALKGFIESSTKADNSFDSRFWLAQVASFCAYMMWRMWNTYKYSGIKRTISICLLPKYIKDGSAAENLKYFFENIESFGRESATVIEIPVPVGSKFRPNYFLLVTGRHKTYISSLKILLTQDNAIDFTYLSGFQPLMCGFEHFNKMFGMPGTIKLLNSSTSSGYREAVNKGAIIFSSYRTSLSKPFELSGKWQNTPINIAFSALGKPLSFFLGYSRGKKIKTIYTQGSETTAKVGSIIY